MLKIAFSPDRHFSPSKAEKVPKSRPKWSPKSAKMPPKRPPRRTRFLLHFWARFLAKNEPQNGAQNGPGAPLFRHLFHMWSQISPLAPLLSTFGRFWCLQGSRNLGAFQLILASFRSPCLPPTLQFWDHMVPEILEHQSLQHPCVSFFGRCLTHVRPLSFLKMSVSPRRRAHFRIFYPMS